MESVNNDYLGKHKKFRVNSKKLATAFLVSAFIVAIVVFWWLKLVGITVTGEAFCGLSEHTHSDECYISEVICTFENNTSGTLPGEEATTEEAETYAQEETTEEPTEITTSAHVHTDECYSKTLSCTKTEHIHTNECFPDKTADVETVSDWLGTIKSVEITNNIPENLVGIALSQVGYEESKNNFEFDSEGNRNGYTRYGDWYGNTYGKWNVMFVSFCLHYSNIDDADALKSAGAEAMKLAWQKKYAYAAADDYIPERGDVVFIDSDGDGASDTVGIIVFAGENVLQVVMGDSNNSVEMVNIDIDDNIIGYGLTGELYFEKDKEPERETTQPVTEPEEEITEYSAPVLMMSTAPDHDILYLTDLTSFIVDVNFKTLDNVEIVNGSTVYIGQSYIISMEFKEDNEGEQWVQFGHNDQHFLTYQIPDNIECEPFTEWHQITAKTENGTIEDVGTYFIDENGYCIPGAPKRKAYLYQELAGGSGSLEILTENK